MSREAELQTQILKVLEEIRTIRRMNSIIAKTCSIAIAALQARLNEHDKEILKIRSQLERPS